MTDLRILINIAEELEGQCVKDVEDCCSERGIEFLDLTPEDFAVINDMVFLCDGCGWWCGIDEQADGGELCEDCRDST